MKKLSGDEIKNIQLNILCYIDDICQKNGIKYFLCGGTLIGAVRHKGYIPWDDDIDIILPRPDYMRLVELLYNDMKYRSLSIYHNDDYCYSFAKVVDTSTVLKENNVPFDIKDMGVYIDLFPLDGLPKTKTGIYFYYKLMMILRNLLYSSLYSSFQKPSKIIKYPFKYIYWKFSVSKGWKYWINKVEKLTLKYNYQNSQMVGCQSSGYGPREVFSHNSFCQSLRVPFENYSFNIPVGYDEYLTKLYGNYMIIPPKSKQHTRHNFEAYLK